jgi:uncharacterized protein (DUF305 family)
MRSLTFSCLALCLLAAAARVSAAPVITPEQRENEAAMQRMHEGMMIQYSGDADRDFVNGMIPHHQGAIDMAQTELRYGRDPELRALAKNIVAAQEHEIGQMKRWQAGHDKAHKNNIQPMHENHAPYAPQ